MKEQPASSFPPRVGPSLPPPVAKLENEPSEAEITAALEAAAAAAAGGATQPASASAAAGAAPRAAEPAAPPPKQEINYALSGRLAQAAQPTTLPGTTNVGYSEPPDARLPDDHWRLYVFKDGSVLGDPLSLHRKSCYMFGRDENAVDIHVAHPSCSKQHAVIQFRLREVQLPDGQLDHVVKSVRTRGTRAKASACCFLLLSASNTHFAPLAMFHLRLQAVSDGPRFDERHASDGHET